MDSQDLLVTALIVGAGVGGYYLYRRGKGATHSYSTRTGLYPFFDPEHPERRYLPPRRDYPHPYAQPYLPQPFAEPFAQPYAQPFVQPFAQPQFRWRGFGGARGAMQRCPSNLFDQTGRCFQSPGSPSPVQNSNFDPMNGAMCQCWANVDVFGNIQDHNSCYPSHDDASNRTNGFPGRPADNQGGDYFTAVPCPMGAAPLQPPMPAGGGAPPPTTTPAQTSGYFTGCVGCDANAAYGWET